MTDISAAIEALPEKTVLVVDDDAPLRTRLGRALEQRGFEVTAVGAVGEAGQTVKERAPAFAVLDAREGGAPPPPDNPMSADRVRWEHIQRVYELCGHNISETARRLNMHRRTLQRILAKRAPR